MDLSFKNKTVLITGATRGIGKQIAHDFADLGAQVVLTGTKEEEIAKLVNERVISRNWICVDFTNEKSVALFIEYISNMKIDICINNAGINRIAPFCEVKEDDWDDILNVNLKAPFLICQRIAEKMKKQCYGRIVNIASIYGVISREKRVAYSTSKSGLIGLTRAMAIDLAPYNILVNSVSAGFVDTDMTRNILSGAEIKNLEKQIPLGRLATREDISKVVLFLASEMNTYITAQNIIVDGGYTNV